jgi:hypothetical protein
MAAPSWYSNSGCDERLHRPINRPGLPKGIDNHANRVFCFRVIIKSTVRAFNPTDRQQRNDRALPGFGFSRLAHEFGSLAVLKVSNHGCDLRKHRVTRIGGINQPPIRIEKRVMCRCQNTKDLKVENLSR